MKINSILIDADPPYIYLICGDYGFVETIEGDRHKSLNGLQP